MEEDGYCVVTVTTRLGGTDVTVTEEQRIYSAANFTPKYLTALADSAVTRTLRGLGYAAVREVP